MSWKDIGDEILEATSVPCVLDSTLVVKKNKISKDMDFKIPCQHESIPENSFVGEKQQKTRFSAGQFP